MTGAMVDCPAPDCDYKGSKEQVKGHWGGSQDEQHTGKWHEAFEAYQDAREGNAEQPQEDAQARTRGSEAASDSGGELTIPDDGEDTGGSSGTSEEASDDDYVCPSCGSDLYDLRDRDIRADFRCVDDDCAQYFADT